MKKNIFQAKLFRNKEKILLHSVSLRKVDLLIFFSFPATMTQFQHSYFESSPTANQVVAVSHTCPAVGETQAPPSCAAAVKGSSRGSLTRACSRWGAGGAMVVQWLVLK